MCRSESSSSRTLKEKNFYRIIIQEMVEAEASLETVLDDFHRWLDEEKLVPSATGADARFAFVTCGDWDLKTLLPTQLDHLGVPVPPYFRSWINMKVIFAEATSIYPRNLPYMLHHLKLPLIGRLHSGIGKLFVSVVLEAIWPT